MSEARSDENSSPGPEDSATSNGLRILIPDTENHAEPSKTWLEDGTMVQNESARALYEEGDSFAGLKLERVWDAGMSSPVSMDEDGSKEPEIDVVHIVGALTSQHTSLGLPDLLWSMLRDGSGQRELLFFVDIASLLNDDAEFTRRSVHAEAHRLLSGLKHFQHSNTELSRRAIIFVAYDVGAIILQKAISIASCEHPGEPGIFTDTARLIFCGCFLRAENEEKMGMKILKFLDASKDSEDWSYHLTLPSAQNLASVSKEARSSFLRSKFALRSRVISFYAGPKSRQIQKTFDYFTATLGIATELVIEEESQDGNGSVFPQLAANLTVAVRGWDPDRWQALAALQSTLMSMVPQSAQMLSTSQSRNHPIFASEAYQTWRSQSGTQILYIDGPDNQANVEAAEQIGLEWVRDRSFNGGSGNVFSFLFDSRDPLRNSIGPMLTATFLHFFWNSSSYEFRKTCSVFRDHQKLQNAWLEQDILNLAYLLYPWMSENTPMLLLDLEECNKRSREAFWTFLAEIAGKSEEPVKFVVTSNKPGGLGWFDVLREELKRWPEIKLLEYNNSPNENSEPADPDKDIDAYHKTLTSHLCPKGIATSEVRAHLERLKSMDRASLDTNLRLLETYSRWPAAQSSTNLDLFCSLLKDVFPTSTPHATLDSILESIPDQNWLRWLLSWTSFGQRPMTSSELAMLIYYCTKTSGEHMSLVGEEDIQRSLTKIDSQLRGFVELNEDKVHISGAVLELWDSSDGNLWTTVKQTASETTANFLLDYLRLQHVQDRLNGLYGQYEGLIKRSKEGLTPPLIPDGRDAVFYAVQALPYHLSRITVPDQTRKSMRDPDGAYTAWAKVYWAMSNPFSRSEKGPLTTAWATWETSPEFGPFNLVRNRLNDEQSNEGEDVDEDTKTPMDKLVAAVKANNEDLSVVLAEEVLADFKKDKQTLTSPEMTEKDEARLQTRWPPSITWRATWLGMNRLLGLLLRDGLRDEDERPGEYNPSRVFLASRQGNSEAVDLLVRSGADIKAMSYSISTPLFVASVRGHHDIIKTLLEKDGSVLDEPQPTRPPYIAAAWGCWKAVKVYVENGADPDMFMSATPVPAAETRDLESHASGVDDWTPLTAACLTGYVKTARVLLENGADPNKAGPFAYRLPLYFAAVEDGNVEIVRLLLRHKADPNHALLQTPILNAIIQQDKVSDDTKIILFNILLDNNPPVEVDKPADNGQTALMAAAMKEDKAAIRWLLEHGADINAMDSESRHALFYAVLNRKHLAVEELLKHREKPHLEVSDTSGRSLVEATLGDISLLQMLVDAGADLTYENEQKQTILNVAVATGDADMVKFLLSLKGKNVDIHHRDTSGWSPILDATGFKANAEVARILMDHGARLSDVTPYGSSPLHLAAERVPPALLRVLLEYHTADDLAMRDSSGCTPLLTIYTFQEPETLDCIRLLVRAGADVNAQNNYGSTALMKSAEFGPEAGVVHDYLLSQPEIDIKLATKLGITALHTACQFSDVALVAKLLKHGADTNARALLMRSTPLIAACISTRPGTDIGAIIEDEERIVRDLVSHGADINAMTGISVFSPLCAASLYAGVGTINYLLDKSASVQKADPLGRLPIHFAAANGLRNFEAVALVHGDNIMVCDKFKKNALHWAAEFGHVDTVRAILEKLPPEDRKVHVNAGDVDGWTPLAWACRPTAMDAGSYWTMSETLDYAATIRCLLDHGADKFARFRIGQDEESMEEFTPLKMAKRCGLDDDVLRLLDVGQPGSTKSDRASQDENENVLLVDEKKYSRTGATCEFCLSEIWGIVWSCMSCGTGDYVLCKKCYRIGHVEHQRTVADDRKGEDHLFEIKAHRAQEFEDPPSVVSSVKAPSIAGSDKGAASGQDTPVNQQGEGEVTPGLDDGSFEIDQLDFPDIDDLGGLGV